MYFRPASSIQQGCWPRSTGNVYRQLRSSGFRHTNAFSKTLSIWRSRGYGENLCDNKHLALTDAQIKMLPSSSVLCRCSSTSQQWTYSTLSVKNFNSHLLSKHLHYWNRLTACPGCTCNSSYYLGQICDYASAQLRSSRSYTLRYPSISPITWKIVILCLENFWQILLVGRAADWSPTVGACFERSLLYTLFKCLNLYESMWLQALCKDLTVTQDKIYFLGYMLILG